MLQVGDRIVQNLENSSNLGIGEVTSIFNICGERKYAIKWEGLSFPAYYFYNEVKISMNQGFWVIA